MKSPYVPTAHKHVFEQQQGAVQKGWGSQSGEWGSGRGCISLGSTDRARMASVCRLAKTNTAQRRREAVMGEQMNHHSDAAFLKTVPARAKPGPVVSCCPLWYTARASMTHGQWCAKISRPISHGARPARSQGLPLLPPPEELNEGFVMTRV